MSIAVATSEVTPWLGFAAAIWVQIAAGNTYSFPLYSNKMKTELNYTQTQIDSLGVAVDIGENVGILAGFMCNKLAPWGILAIGSSACFLGYGTLWLVLSRTISPLPYWVILIAQWLGANSATWFITAALVTNMRNFPESRGLVSGILKGLSGLGGAVFTELFSAFLSKDPIKLLAFLTVAPLLTCLMVMYFVRPCTPSPGGDIKEQKHLNFIQWITMTLSLYLLLTSIVNKTIASNRPLLALILGIFMLLLIASPIIIPIKVSCEKTVDRELQVDNLTAPLIDNVTGETETSDISYVPNPDPDLSNDSTRTLPVSSDVPSSSNTSIVQLVERPEADDNEVFLLYGEGAIDVTEKKRRPKRGEDFNLRQAIIKADFWLLFIAFFCGVGSGVTVLNNLAQIGVAEGYNDVTILLSILGVCNFLGRLGGGVVSEYFLRQCLLPRPFWMVVTQVLMIICFIFFATALPGTLYACAFVLGICYGVQFSIMVPTASEIFGLKHFGMIYNFQTMGNPLGALFFSIFLAGSLYDKEAEKQRSHTCLGPNCFRLTFILMALVCAAGVFVSAILTKRLKPVYENIYANASFRIQKNTKTSEKV